ncbi:MAG TPA: alpha/beta hydrolase [Gaiella sp.]|nr:alpha/beta hydrolase [Gaiella sp.]
MVRFVATVGAVLAVVIPAEATTTPELPLHACRITGGIAALCGRFDVPENRVQQGGRSISLRVAVIPARERPRARDPLVYLAGGPGGSAVDSAAAMLPALGGTTSTGNDPQDPLSHVARASRELPNSSTVVVPGAGHGALQLGCMPRLARAFVERGTSRGLDMRCAVAYEAPAFVIP